jgi:hypothetical protein
MAFNIKRGWKKMRGMVELESPKEFMKDYRKLNKEGSNIYWNIKLDDPQASKKTFKGVKSFKVWGKGIKSVGQDIFKVKNTTKEGKFWK